MTTTTTTTMTVDADDPAACGLCVSNAPVRTLVPRGAVRGCGHVPESGRLCTACADAGPCPLCAEEARAEAAEAADAAAE